MAKSVASKKRTLSIMEALLEKSDEAHRLSTNDLLEMLERGAFPQTERAFMMISRL